MAATRATQMQFWRRAFVLVAIGVILPLAWFGLLDRLAEESVDAGLKRALITFATARGANAAISALQETTIGVSLLFVNGTASPFQVLDPINDLVERFSDLMLAASVSLGMQRLLIVVGSTWVVSAAVTVLLAVWAGCWWLGRRPHSWLVRALAVALFVRFAVPLAAVGSEGAYLIAMSSQYEVAQTEVGSATDSIRKDAPADIDGVKGMVERQVLKKAGTPSFLDALLTKVESAIRHIVTLMALFLVQTVVLPMLFLWLAFRLFGALMSWRPATRPIDDDPAAIPALPLRAPVP